MNFRFRIAAWVVASCALLVGLMIFTARLGLEEELRAGRVDPNHPQKRAGRCITTCPRRKSRISSAS